MYLEQSVEVLSWFLLTAYSKMRGGRDKLKAEKKQKRNQALGVWVSWGFRVFSAYAVCKRH